VHGQFRNISRHLTGFIDWKRRGVDNLANLWISFGSRFDFNLRKADADRIEKRLASYMLVSALALTVVVGIILSLRKEEYDAFSVTETEFAREQETIRFKVFGMGFNQTEFEESIKWRIDTLMSVSLTFVLTALVLSLTSYVMLISVNPARVQQLYSYLHGPIAGLSFVLMVVGSGFIMAAIPSTLYIKVGYSIYDKAYGWIITFVWFVILPVCLLSVAQFVVLNRREHRASIIRHGAPVVAARGDDI